MIAEDTEFRELEKKSCRKGGEETTDEGTSANRYVERAILKLAAVN